MKHYAFTALLLLAGYAQAYDFQALTTHHMVPSYKRLESTTLALKTAAADYCQSSHDKNISLLQARYVEAFAALQRIRHFGFGPSQYLSFWPDKRNTVGRHLARLLKDPILDSDTPPDLSGKSVAIQGFSALERLIFGDQPPDKRRCRAIIAITANLYSNTIETYRDYVTRFESGDARNKSDTELGKYFLNKLHVALEFTAQHKLEIPLGASLEKARGRQAEGRRSQTAMIAISNNLDACHELYRFAFAGELQNSSLHKRIEAGFEQARNTLVQITLPLSKAVSDPKQREFVKQLRNDVMRIKLLISREMAPTLKLPLGFNSLDGD